MIKQWLFFQESDHPNSKLYDKYQFHFFRIFNINNLLVIVMKWPCIGEFDKITSIILISKSLKIIYLLGLSPFKDGI